VLDDVVVIVVEIIAVATDVETSSFVLVVVTDSSLLLLLVVEVATLAATAEVDTALSMAVVKADRTRSRTTLSLTLGFLVFFPSLSSVSLSDSLSFDNRRLLSLLLPLPLVAPSGPSSTAAIRLRDAAEPLDCNGNDPINDGSWLGNELAFDNGKPRINGNVGDDVDNDKVVVGWGDGRDDEDEGGDGVKEEADVDEDEIDEGVTNTTAAAIAVARGDRGNGDEVDRPNDAWSFLSASLLVGGLMLTDNEDDGNGDGGGRGARAFAAAIKRAVSSGTRLCLVVDRPPPLAEIVFVVGLMLVVVVDGGDGEAPYRFCCCHRCCA
jgi:hypothetical protein